MGWPTVLALVAAAQAAPPPGAVQTVIQAPGPNGPLEGTLLEPPASPPDAPVVLIVPGSGPTDRDGNGPGGLRASTYRLLAEGLAARGVASVRIDKRGMHGSRGAVPDPDAVRVGDYAEDVHAWAAAIRRRGGAPCVWVLGHSEGGLVALVAGQGQASDLCGLVLVATAGRPLGAVLREQLRANPANAPVLDEAMAAIARLEAGERVDESGMDPALRPLFRPEVQGFLFDAFSLDPLELIAACRLPVLIVQGLRDIQIGRGDAEALERAGPAASLALLPDANHVLKTVPSDDRAENVAAYLDPARPLAPGVVDAIADFIVAPRKAR